MTVKPKTIDDFLSALTEDKRATLEKLRKAIKSIVPEAEEGFSYGLPAFRLHGKPLAAFSASAQHCSFYPMSGAITASFQEELKDYDTSKGAIRFAAEKPLPKALLRKLIKARIDEIEGKSKTNKKPLPSKTTQKISRQSVQKDSAVDEFLRTLDHPLKKEIEEVRQMILGVSPEIHEGIKWNSPSFRTREYFATINMRARDHLKLILHLGAKVKDNSTTGIKIPDPEGLLNWLAKDRCFVKIDNLKNLKARQSALQDIIRNWIKQA